MVGQSIVPVVEHALGRFAAKCEAVEMRVRTSKSEAMVFCWKTMDCSLQVGRELLPQAKELKYLEVLFTSEDKTEREIIRPLACISRDVGDAPD